MLKPKTYFIDIDGCIFYHLGKGATRQWFIPNGSEKVLPGVREFLDGIESQGGCIVLVTARKERYRAELESKLRASNILYDKLVMGVTSGERIVINDKKPGGAKSCTAMEIERNAGL